MTSCRVVWCGVAMPPDMVVGPLVFAHLLVFCGNTQWASFPFCRRRQGDKGDAHDRERWHTNLLPFGTLYGIIRTLDDLRMSGLRPFFLQNVRSRSVAQTQGSFPSGRRGRCMWCISGRLVQSWRNSRAIGPRFHMPFRHAQEQLYEPKRWYPLWAETCSFFCGYRYCFCNKYNCVDCVILWWFTVLPRSFTKVEGSGKS
jgi:hypothetical protein